MLTSAVSALPNDHPSNLPVVEMNIPYKERFLEAFGPELRLKQLITLDVEALQRGLRLSEIEARQLKLSLLGSVGRLPEPPVVAPPDPSPGRGQPRRGSRRGK